VYGLVVWTRDGVVLGHLATALKTKGVAAGQREGLFVLVVIGLEADAALKY
jgi:hypothetical protein